MYPISFGLQYYDVFERKKRKKVYKFPFLDLTKITPMRTSFYTSTGIRKAILLREYFLLAKKMLMSKKVGILDLNQIRAFKAYFEAECNNLDKALLQEVKLWEGLRDIVPEQWCSVM